MLNTDTPRTYETPSSTNAVPVALDTKIYEGALVGRTADGLGRPLQAGDIAIGFAKGLVGDICELKSTGKVVLEITGITKADVGAKVYASDDNTFTLTESGNSLVGKLVRCESENIGIVAFDFLHSDETTEQPTQNEGA